MSDNNILDRVKSLVTKPVGMENAIALESCCRILRREEDSARRWVSLTRAVNKASNPEKVVAALETLMP